MIRRRSIAKHLVLYDPVRHENLRALRWRDADARVAIDRIAEDARTAFTPDGLWPVHPIDLSPERPADCLKPMFNGAGGVFWALRRLRAHGAAIDALDDRTILAALPDLQHEDDVRLNRERSPSFAIGDTGLALLAWWDNPDTAHASALMSCIDACAAQAEQGFALGAAGGLLASLFAFERSGDTRWRAAFERHANALWLRWTDEPELGGHHWLQTLYGHRDRPLGALHGLGGIQFALMRGFLSFEDERLVTLAGRTRKVLLATASRADAFANWPRGAGPSTREGDNELLLQHCIGAPGIVATSAWIPAGEDPAFDALLLQAGALIWHAGPTNKLPSLCHGAPGSGYAFLKLFERTGAELWLDRARQFGLHGVQQADLALSKFGQRKYSLWTGDLGLALFLQDCLRARAEIPLFDVF